MSIQYKYTPFCPHCRRQNYYMIEKNEAVARPEIVKEQRKCQFCHRDFYEESVIYPEKRVDLRYEFLMFRMNNENRTKDEKESNEFIAYLIGDKNLEGKMMHGVKDVSQEKNIPFAWMWDDDDSCYTLKFEYKDLEREIYAPMWNDIYIKYLHEYVDLARKAVDEYAEKLGEESTDEQS